MGMIIDTSDELRLGLEVRRESFVIIANEWAEENTSHLYLSATVSDPANPHAANTVSIELDLDQVEPLIEGLIRLRDYVRERGR